MTPEEKARVNIDKMLTESGFMLQDMKEFNRSAALGIATFGSSPPRAVPLIICFLSMVLPLVLLRQRLKIKAYPYLQLLSSQNGMLKVD